MGLPGFQGHLVGFVGDGAIEVGVAEKRFGCVGAGLEKVFAGSGEAQVMFADIAEQAFAAQVAPGLVARTEVKRSRGSRIGLQRRSGVRIEGDPVAVQEIHCIGPLARPVWRKMRAPLGAALGRRFARLAVGGEVSRGPCGCFRFRR